MKGLRGAVAVVTGAATRIGRAVAEMSRNGGMKVVLTDIELLRVADIIGRPQSGRRWAVAR